MMGYIRGNDPVQFSSDSRLYRETSILSVDCTYR